MKLFDLVNYQVQISPEALVLEPFAVIWNRDKSKDKAIAIAELAAVYFMADFKSDYNSIFNEEERLKQIVSVLKALPDSWKPDKEFVEAINFYRERSKTASTELYEASVIALGKLDKFLRNISLAETDKSGKPKYNAKQINDTIKSLPDTVKKIKELEDIVKKEQEAQNNNLRGGRQKGLYVD